MLDCKGFQQNREVYGAACPKRLVMGCEYITKVDMSGVFGYKPQPSALCPTAGIKADFADLHKRSITDGSMMHSFNGR